MAESKKRPFGKAGGPVKTTDEKVYEERPPNPHRQARAATDFCAFLRDFSGQWRQQSSGSVSLAGIVAIARHALRATRLRGGRCGSH